MKSQAIISVAALLSLSLAVPASATEGTQPPAGALPSTAGTGDHFEQKKSDHLERLDDRINSLQMERKCVQSAGNYDELRACKMRHKFGKKERREGMKRRSGPDGSTPVQVK